MQSPHLIELVGLPGSGKTTVARLLREELTAVNLDPLSLPEAGRTLASRSWLGAILADLPGRSGDRLAWKLFEIERLTRGIGFLLVHPGFAVRLLLGQVRRPKAAHARARRVVYWWIRTVGARSLLMSRRRNNEVAVLEEGLCHRVVQLYSSADEVPNPVEISEYVQSIPLPDVLVHVVCPVDEAHRRVTRRGVWERLAGVDPSWIRGFLSSSELAIAQLLDSAASRKVRVVDVDNSGDSPPSGNEILALLRTVGVLA